MNALATNQITGEITQLPMDTPEQMVEAWRYAQELARIADALKSQLKVVIPHIARSDGLFDEVNGYKFRVSNVQRMNYDKAIMREVLDPDAFDVLLKPDKTAVDKYLKDNLEALGDTSTQLRRAMIAEGQPYQVVKLERVSND